MTSSTMAAVAPASRWRRPFDVWLDGIERGWGIPLALAVFVALWVAILHVAYLSGGLHPDTIEAWSLGRTLAWGSMKHPPLMSWIARGWTTLFPLTDWSFQLLAMVNAAFALWAVDLIARRYVGGDKRALLLLLLLWLPVYQFHAQRFNANAVLLPLWPLATLCFLRSFETRQLGWAAAAGLVSALAILGKYYSAFLVVGFAVAALCHPQRRAYFTSAAPFVSAAVGALALLPHAHWMLTSGVGPFDYALAAHGGISIAAAAMSALLFLLGVVATLALPLAVFAVLISSRRRDYLADLRSLNAGLWLLLLIGVVTIIVPPLATIVLKSSITATWAAQGLFLFILVAVCASTFPISRNAVDWLAALSLAATVLALVFAPVHAIYRNAVPFKEGRNYYELAAQELGRRWHAQSAAPLGTVSGDTLAMSLSFYDQEHPAYMAPNDTAFASGMPPREVLQKGWAAACLQDEPDCLLWMRQAASMVPGAQSLTFSVQPQLWGRPGRPAQVSAVIVPPAS